MKDEETAEFVESWVTRLGKKIGLFQANSLRQDAIIFAVKDLLIEKGIATTGELNNRIASRLTTLERHINDAPVLSELQRDDLKN